MEKSGGGKWTNRERVLVFSSRGASYRTRHLMNNFKTLMPHAKSESKLDKQTRLKEINDVMEMANCSKAVFFECKKRKDVYLWLSTVGGPSVKFLLHNLHTMEELRLTGNCLKASRPILSFDAQFDALPHLQLVKQLLKQTFATPNRHPRSQPFIDHVFSFSLTPDKRIWFRNFQIVDSTAKLQEIGPRMVLELIRIFAGSFDGPIIYENPLYESPNELRRRLKQAQSTRYSMKKDSQQASEMRRQKRGPSHAIDQLDAVFDEPQESGQARAIERAIDHPKKKKKRKGQ